MFTKSKVQFQDQPHDDYILENSVLQSKLRSKIEALTIMSKELDKCHMERDRYKVLVEQLKIKNMTSVLEGYNSNMYKHSMSGGELLAKTREQNNLLRLEVETLRSKLDEALGDISALRKQLHIFESNAAYNASSIFCDSNKEYEELVHQLEITHKKYQQLQLDYRATLDEKEELASDRDYYKGKVMRLNHQISVILNRAKASREDGGCDGPKPIVDVDSVVNENKYLHERITQLQVEKEIVKRNLNKYKNIIENRNKTDSTNCQKNFLEIMTQKQVRAFLDVNSKSGLKRSSAAELKSLCMGLFESLNDKAIALQHQRKTNQILANRVTELEKTLESWCNGEKYVPIFPSQMLLDEFIPDPEISKDYAHKENDVASYHDNNDAMKDDSDDDEKSKVASEDSNDTKSLTSSNKTVLPHELEELVKEALAELKTIN